MEFFDTTKSIIENVYLLSGPVLAILGGVAIMQLRLTKKAMITNSQREAANLAASQISTYNNQIIPLIDKLYLFERENKLNKIKIEIGEFNRDYLIKIVGKKEFNKLNKERIINGTHFLRVVNSLEAFATYFTKGVADEDIAFSAVGRTFCFSIESMFFDIASCLETNDNSFQNIIELYQIWNDRLVKQKLTSKNIQLMNELEKISDNKISPIGTK